MKVSVCQKCKQTVELTGGVFREHVTADFEQCEASGESPAGEIKEVSVKTPEIIKESIGQRWLGVSDPKYRQAPYVSLQCINGFWLVLCDVVLVKSGKDSGKTINTPVNYHELDRI